MTLINGMKVKCKEPLTRGDGEEILIGEGEGGVWLGWLSYERQYIVGG